MKKMAAGSFKAARSTLTACTRAAPRRLPSLEGAADLANTLILFWLEVNQATPAQNGIGFLENSGVRVLSIGV
jgi:hypothetical protein